MRKTKKKPLKEMGKDETVKTVQEILSKMKWTIQIQTKNRDG